MNDYRKDYSSTKTPGNGKVRKKSQSDNKMKFISDQGHLYSMRDLNFFIKAMERDMVKNLNSMPTTPTSASLQKQAIIKGEDLNQTTPNLGLMLSKLQPFEETGKKRKMLQYTNNLTAQYQQLQ